MAPSEQIEQPRLIALEPASASRAGLSQRQQHFLERLQSLSQRREDLLRTNPQDKEGLMLLSRGIFATLMDCIAEGVGDQAHAILVTSQRAPKSV